MQIATKRKHRFIADKTDLKPKTVTRNTESNDTRRLLYHDNGVNSSRKYNNCQYLCKQH